MTQPSPSTRNSGLRVFSAAILSALLIVMPFVQLAAAEGQRSRGRGQSSESGQPALDSSSQGSAANVAAAPENLFLNAPIPKPAPEPFAVTPAQLKVTLDDGLGIGVSKRPGETITYTATIQNTNPTDDATNVTFTDDLTANLNLTFLAGSVQTQPIAKNDTFAVLGNVGISVADGAAASGGSSGDLLNNDFDPDTAGNTGLTITTLGGDASAPFAGTSVRGGNVTATTGNGAFEYNPPVGYEGTDSFTYTVTDADGKTDTATVNITITGMIWFINNAATACTTISTASGCGRLTSPLSTLTSFDAANGGATMNGTDVIDPEAGDHIFIYTGNSPGTPYSGPLTLENTQRLVGQGASNTLASITGVTVPAFSDTLPATSGTSPLITSAANGINLAQNNHLRGFTVGNVGNANRKLNGSGFGQLTIGNNTTPDIFFSGTGMVMFLQNGTIGANSGIGAAASTGSTAQGLLLTQITAGTLPFSSTNISGTAGNGIEVNGSQADINFGTTTISGGSNGVLLANNSAGTRSFGSLSISGGSGIGFLHQDPDGAGAGVGGGAVSVTGATLITNPIGNGIDISNSNANLSFAATTVDKSTSAAIGVNLTSNATRTIGFTSLTVTTTTGFALLTNNSGTVNAGGGSLTQSGAGGGAASLTSTTLGLTFTSVSSDGGVNGLLFSTGSGTFASGTTNLQNNTAIGLLMSGSGVAANFGNTTVNSSNGDAVDISGQTANVTFAALNLSPDANFRGLDVSTTSGTITSTSGNVATTGAEAININGPAGRTPLAMVLTNVDSTNSTGRGVFLNLTSGNLTVNDAGTATNIQNSTGTGIEVSNSGAGTVNFGNTTVNSTGNANGDDTGSGVILTTNAGAITFGSLTVTPDSGERGLYATDSDVTAAGTITIGSGTITTTNDTAVEITGQATGNRTPLNIQLTTVNTTGGGVAANGIRLSNTSATGSPGGFRVLGNGGSCSNANTSCTGGRITNTAGADGLTGGNGVRLDNANNVRLTRMRIDSNQNNGIRGLGADTFVLETSYVHNNGNVINGAHHESGVNFDGSGANGLTGNAHINNSDIRNNFDFNLYFDNNSGTLHLTIDGCTIRETDPGSLSNDNIGVDLDQTATVFFALTDSTFGGAGGSHLDFVVAGTSTSHITVTGNTMTGTMETVANYLGMNIKVAGGPGSWNVRYNISNNIMTGTRSGNAILVNKGGAVGNSGGVMQGTISGNTIGNAGVSESGATQSSGITVEAVGDGGTHTAAVTGNNIFQYEEQGIDLKVGEDLGVANNADAGATSGPAAALNVTVTGNTISNPGPNALHGIHLNAGPQIGDNNTMCADIGGAGGLSNNVTNAGSEGAPNFGSDIRPRQRNASRVLLPGYGGTAFDATAIQNYFASRNASTSVSASTNNASGTANDGSFNGGAACTQPLAPTVPTLPSAMFSVPRPEPREYFASLTNSEINATVIAAANTREVSPAVSQASFLAPIASALTSSASETGVRVAPSALAHSAEVSSHRSETTEQRSEVSAHHAANSKPETRLTNREERTEVRAHSGTAANVTATVAPLAGTFTVNIGTLPANDSVTITFQVTIANTLTPGTANSVSNQATVTADGGINKVSDDPQTTPPAAGDGNDATVTPIDKFEPVIDIQSSDTTTDQGESVTFTATLTHGTALVDPLPTGTVDFIDQGTAEVLCNDVTLTVNVSNSTAACPTPDVDAGTRTIAAVYSGDGRYDTATDTVVQTVTACGVNPVVTKIADTNDGTCDADCSLREAIATVCNSAGNNTITFASGVGQAFENPATITLAVGLGNLTIDRNMTIQAPAHGVTVVGSGDPAHRVFVVNAGKTATITNMTITGGNSDAIGGGGIKNDGTLTLKYSTVSGNNTTQNGAGIHNSSVLNIVNSTISGNIATIDGGGLVQDGASPTLYMVNSTVSGNTANGFGGGLDLRNGTVTILNSTITGNHSDNDDNANGGAGGMRQQSATVTIRNTIVAGNYKGSGTTTANDIEGTVSGNNNLIGDAATAGGLTNGVNGNIVGAVIANVLDTVLQNNGGRTKTHRLLPGSAAVDAGLGASLPTDTFDADGDANSGEQLDVDQRALARVVDNPNVTNADNGLDIGAVEVNYVISATAGTPQSTAIGTAFATALGATVSESGIPIAGASVTFTAPAAGASGTFAGSGTTTETVSSDGSGVATASAFTANSTAGAYTVSATATGYTGTADFSLTNNAATTAITTQVSTATSTVGSPVSDTATLSGGVNPTGTITFNVYGPNDATCAAAAVFTSAAIPVNGNGNYGSGNFTPTAPGTYRWIATYSGDANNSGVAGLCNDANETVTVSTASPTMTTTASAGVTVGGDVSDTATIAGGFNPTGSITFTLYGPNDATCAGAPVFTSAAIPVNGNGNYGSGNFTTTAPGTYRWIASYTGDSNNAAVAGMCNDANESVVVSQAAPTMTTQASGGVALGGAVSDAATLAGGFNPTGTITFTLYGPNDATCGGAPVFTSAAIPVAGNGVYNSGNFTPTNPGVYRWIATYSGDANNSAVAGMCNDANESVTVGLDVSVQNAQVAEPSSGSANLIFTLSLSAPAPAGGVSVDFNTVDGTAKDGVGEANQDYTSSSGTVTFAVGQQVRTIHVPALADGDNAEVDETMTVTLSNPSATLNIADGTGVGTITVANTAGTMLISEFRQFGPGPGNDPLDDFVEIYNNTNAPIIIPAGGYGLFRMPSTCAAADQPQLIGTIPAGTVIPARGHFLFTGPIANYTLKDYGSTDGGKHNALLTADLGANENFGLFATADVSQLSSLNRLDAVGFGINNQNACDLLREGSTLNPVTTNLTLLGQHSFARKVCDWVQGSGCTAVPAGSPKDTNQNLVDFRFSDTNATNAGAGQNLGAPGPERAPDPGFPGVPGSVGGSPIKRDAPPGNSGLNVYLLDTSVAAAGVPNRFRNPGGSGGALGEMTLRYRVLNNTGAPVTRLRYRIIDISTYPQPPGVADLRARTGSDVSVSNVNDPVTCNGGTPCTVLVRGTTLESPPTQTNGGGYNSTLSSGTVTVGTPLPNGESIPISFVLGVQQPGTFRFYIIVEALP